MNQTARWKRLRSYQWLAGLMDVMTGLLLMVAPEWTLRLMRVQHLPTSLEMVSFVGVFVMGVGAGYLCTLRIPRTEADAACWGTVWLLSGISRSLVVLFLGWQLALGTLEPAWAGVLVTDLALASIQFIGLSRGWLAPLPLPQDGSLS